MLTTFARRSSRPLPVHTQPSAILRWRAVASTSTSSSSQAAVDNAAAAIATNGSEVVAVKKSKVQLLNELSKTKLSALVVMTTGAGFLMAGGPISWTSFTAATVGTTLAACSANTFNQVYEIKNDKLMNRTFQRPLPSGQLTKAEAMTWGVTTGLLSTGILGLGCNPLTAALGASNIFLYSLVYTPMKTRSELNTWVGSVVGAIPPVMGWTAATGTLLSPESALAGSLLFLWQFPHFFALSWRLRKDYARGGFKMLPCADPTGQRTASAIMRYSAYLAPLPILSSMAGVTSSMFAVEGTAVNAYLLYLASKFQQKPNTANSNKVFFCSLWYLPVLLGCMVFHSENWYLTEDEKKAKASQNTEERMFGFSVSEKIKDYREQLKEVCVHELLWGKDSNETKLPRVLTNSSQFCPVVAKDNALTGVTAVANAGSDRVAGLEMNLTDETRPCSYSSK